MSKMRIYNCPICNENEFTYMDYLKAPSQDDWTFDCFKNKTLSTCKNCNFTFTTQLFEEGSLSKFYNNLYSDSKLEPFKAYENYEFSSRSFSHVNFIKTNIDLRDNMNILEIGPNQNGMIASFRLYCKPNYFYYEQLDFPVLNHYGGLRLGEYFSKKAISSLEPDKKMDLIVLSHVFEHFEPQHLNRDVEAIKFALKLNGCVSIEVPLQTFDSMHGPHTQFFNVKNMSLLFEKHGFEIVASQSIRKSIGKTKNKPVNNSFRSSRLPVRFIKKIISLLSNRKIRLMLLKSMYEKRLKVLYDGRSYMRLLVQKRDTI